TAGQVRDLLAHLDALAPGGLQNPDGGSITIDLTDERTGELRATADPTELRRLARRGRPQHPDPDPGAPAAAARCSAPTPDRPLRIHPRPAPPHHRPRPHLPHARLL